MTNDQQLMTMQKFTTQLRVRHYEMDALGHVNNAVIGTDVNITGNSAVQTLS